MLSDGGPKKWHSVGALSSTPVRVKVGRVLSLRSTVKFDILERVGKLVESPPLFSAPLCAAPSRPRVAGLWCRLTGGRGNC